MAVRAVAVAVAAGTVYAGCAGQVETGSPVVVDTGNLLRLAPLTGPVDHFSNGAYEVLVQIQPGTYRSPGPLVPELGPCEWSRYRTIPGGQRVLAEHHTVTGPATLTVLSGDALIATDGCRRWVKQS